MFSSRRSNNSINRIHERSLKTVYNDTSMRQQNIRTAPYSFETTL